MSGTGRAVTPALARRHESITSASGATPTLPGLPPGPQCADCGKPVQQRPGAAAPKRCPEHTLERKREQNRKYWRERHATDPEFRERKREAQRERMSNPDYRERKRKYNREQNRERYNTDPEFRERVKERVRQRNLKTRGPSRRGRNLLVRLIVRQGALCALCETRLPEYAADIHVDHIVPVAKGGTSDPENLQAVCADCNRRKGTN